MTEVTPNLPHLGNFCKYCFMGTLLLSARLFVRFFGYVFLSVHFAENNAVKGLKNINSNEISI